MTQTNNEVLGALRIIGAVARADGKITEEERQLFRDAVTDFQAKLDDGTSIDKLLTEESNLEEDLTLVISPVIRRAVFEVAFAMSAVDGATREEGTVLKRIRSAFAVEGEKSAFEDALSHNWAHAEIEPTLNDAERAARVKTLLAKRQLIAAVLGALPIPFVGDVGVLLQVHAVIDEVSTLWGQPLTRSEKWGRFGTVLTVAFAQGAAHSLIKLFPGWGSLAGSVSGAIGSYAIVGAVGRVVNYHFEKDGNTTPAELRKVFNEQKAEMKKAYAADKKHVESTSEAHAPELAALAKQLETKEITVPEYEQRLAQILETK